MVILVLVRCLDEWLRGSWPRLPARHLDVSGPQRQP